MGNTKLLWVVVAVVLSPGCRKSDSAPSTTLSSAYAEATLEVNGTLATETNRPSVKAGSTMVVTGRFTAKKAETVDSCTMRVMLGNVTENSATVDVAKTQDGYRYEASIKVPPKRGTYEVRILDHRGGVICRRTIDVE